jgi:hypothetical protein
MGFKSISELCHFYVGSPTYRVRVGKVWSRGRSTPNDCASSKRQFFQSLLHLEIYLGNLNTHALFCGSQPFGHPFRGFPFADKCIRSGAKRIVIVNNAELTMRIAEVQEDLRHPKSLLDTNTRSSLLRVYCNIYDKL